MAAPHYGLHKFGTASLIMGLALFLLLQRKPSARCMEHNMPSTGSGLVDEALRTAGVFRPEDVAVGFIVIFFRNPSHLSYYGLMFQQPLGLPAVMRKADWYSMPSLIGGHQCL